MGFKTHLKVAARILIHANIHANIINAKVILSTIGKVKGYFCLKKKKTDRSLCGNLSILLTILLQRTNAHGQQLVLVRNQIYEYDAWMYFQAPILVLMHYFPLPRCEVSASCFERAEP